MFMRNQKQQRGFSLIELMITVAVIGILVAIALPSYQSQVRKSRRAAAQTFLMDVAAKQQQYLIDARVYTTSVADLKLAVPSDVSSFYDISITVGAAPPTFTVTANSKGDQEKDLNNQDLVLNQSGTKTPAGVW